MIKSLLLTLVIGVSSFFGWEHFSKSQLRTPEQEIERFVAKETVSAVEMAEIVDKYPELAGEIPLVIEDEPVEVFVYK
jgi:predicted negative regulator of RcsB-dependent stress response